VPRRKDRFTLVVVFNWATMNREAPVSAAGWDVSQALPSLMLSKTVFIYIFLSFKSLHSRGLQKCDTVPRMSSQSLSPLDSWRPLTDSYAELVKYSCIPWMSSAFDLPCTRYPFRSPSITEDDGTSYYNLAYTVCIAYNRLYPNSFRLEYSIPEVRRKCDKIPRRSSQSRAT
jgi:hypothetical protein